jgi:hypothetical protein
MQQIRVIPAKNCTTNSMASCSSGGFNYRSILKQALKASVYKRLEIHWIENLGVMEKKGIRVLEAIIKTKGCKKFEKNKIKNQDKNGK